MGVLPRKGVGERKSAARAKEAAFCKWSDCFIDERRMPRIRSESKVISAIGAEVKKE